MGSWTIPQPSGPIALYSKEESVRGKTWEQWTVEWWKWIISIPKNKNPAKDMTGDNSREGQDPTKGEDRPVYFLVGALGGTFERRCTIPNKPILFPIVVDEESTAEKPAFGVDESGKLPPAHRDKLEQDATEDQDKIISLNVTIDKATKHEVVLLTGSLVKNRIGPTEFSLDFPSDNLFDAVELKNSTAISDGYWLFLEPPPPGPHTINFQALEDDFEIDVKYYLDVDASLR
jgi:hypothetical protein